MHNFNITRMEKKAQPSGQKSGEYKNLTTSQEDEDAFEYMNFRTDAKKTSFVGSVAHMVKGALGAGVLSAHVAYKKAGVGAALPLTFICGLYMYYCLYILVKASTIMCKRTRVPALSYSDTGEAALACCPKPKLAKWSKCFRITIDAVIGFDLFGSCATYHIIVAKSIKQLVEQKTTTTIEGYGDSPNLRIYMLALIVPIILICMIRHLKWLAPFSLAANCVVAICVGLAVYYAFTLNPSFKNLKLFTAVPAVFEFLGMTVFSMSCAGVVIPIENNMSRPKKFPIALAVGMFLIVLCVSCCAFFGYSAFLEKSESPITINFPFNAFGQVLKVLIAVMITVTYALNFWVPFNITYYYIKKRIDPAKHVRWEYFYRIVCILIISAVAIAFPAIDDLIGFIGSICLSNMAFIWPNVIFILVRWTRPGFGPFKIHLIKHLILIFFGTILLIAGGYVNGRSLIESVFIKK